MLDIACSKRRRRTISLHPISINDSINGRVRDRREFSTTLEAREKGQSIFNLRVKITKVVYFVFAAPLVGCCFWMNGIQEKVFLRKKKRGTTKGGKISRQLTVGFFFSRAMRDFRSTNSSSSIKKEKKKKTRLSQVQGSAMFDSDG